MNPIGNRIRARRMALGMSRNKVATLAGVSPKTITNIELGHTRVPQRNCLSGIANALRTSAADLLFDQMNGSEIPKSQAITAPTSGKSSTSPSISPPPPGGPLFDEVKAFKTKDGRIHTSETEATIWARRAQFHEYCAKNPVQDPCTPEELSEWLLAHDQAVMALLRALK